MQETETQKNKFPEWGTWSILGVIDFLVTIGIILGFSTIEIIRIIDPNSHAAPAIISLLIIASIIAICILISRGIALLISKVVSIWIINEFELKRTGAAITFFVCFWIGVDLLQEGIFDLMAPYVSISHNSGLTWIGGSLLEFLSPTLWKAAIKTWEKIKEKTFEQKV